MHPLEESAAVAAPPTLPPDDLCFLSGTQVLHFLLGLKSEVPWKYHREGEEALPGQAAETRWPQRPSPLFIQPVLCTFAKHLACSILLTLQQLSWVILYMQLREVT